jgi:hypothetical protein
VVLILIVFPLVLSEILNFSVVVDESKAFIITLKSEYGVILHSIGFPWAATTFARVFIKIISSAMFISITFMSVVTKMYVASFDHVMPNSARDADVYLSAVTNLAL